MPKCDAALRRVQTRPADRVELLQHLHAVKIRQYGREIAVERQLSALYQLHDASCCDSFGHRGDRDHRIGRHRYPASHVAPAESAFENDAVRRRSNRSHPGHVVRFHRAAQRLRNPTCVDYQCSSFLLDTAIANASTPTRIGLWWA